MEIDKNKDFHILKCQKPKKTPLEEIAFNWEQGRGMKERGALGSYQASWFLFKIKKMRNMGMTTMTAVTVLIREKSVICAMDERWFGCVYSHRLLLINMPIQLRQFIPYSLHVIHQLANQGAELGN